MSARKSKVELELVDIRYADTILDENLFSKGNPPSDLLAFICRVIYKFESDKQPTKVDSLMELKHQDVVTSGEEMANAQNVGIETYKIMKVNLYLMCCTFDICNRLSNANPIRARIFTYLSAMAYRATHFLTLDNLISKDKKVKEKINMNTTIRLDTVSAVYSQKSSQKNSEKTAIKEELGKDFVKNPWNQIEEYIKSFVKHSFIQKGNIYKKFGNLNIIMNKFAELCSIQANNFYAGIEEYTPIRVKYYEVGGNKKKKDKQIEE